MKKYFCEKTRLTQSDLLDSGKPSGPSWTWTRPAQADVRWSFSVCSPLTPCRPPAGLALCFKHLLNPGH